MTTLEIALIEMEKGNFEEAKEWLERAEKDFSGYTAENLVHFKAYAAIRRMGHNTDKQQEDKEKRKWKGTPVPDARCQPRPCTWPRDIPLANNAAFSFFSFQ